MFLDMQIIARKQESMDYKHIGFNFSYEIWNYQKESLEVILTLR